MTHTNILPAANMIVHSIDRPFVSRLVSLRDLPKQIHLYPKRRNIATHTATQADVPHTQSTPTRIAFFDVDGTLVNSNIVLPYVLLQLRDLVLLSVTYTHSTHIKHNQPLSSAPDTPLYLGPIVCSQMPVLYCPRQH